MVQIPPRRKVRGMESNRKIAVCHIISGDLWAGAEAQAFTMMTGLNKLPAVDVSAIVLNQGKLVQKLKETNIPVAVIDESKYSFLQILKIAGEIVVSRQADILHSHRYKENLVAAMIKRRGHAVHLVQTVHGVQERLSGIKSLKIAAYGKLNEFVSKRYFDRILAVSRDINGTLTGIYGTEAMRHIANAIDLDQIKTVKSSTETRKELGLRSDELVVGAVGRMVAIKGFDIFLRTAQAVLKSSPRTKFVLVGDGPESENLKKLCSDLGISEQVVFAGFRDDILDVINSLDIFLMTSWHEGIPVALLEAMALGKPTVATAVGGINEVLESGVSGLTAPAGDVTAIANHCESLLKSPESRLAIGRRARLRVEGEFSSEQQSQKLYGVYKELVQ